MPQEPASKTQEAIKSDYRENREFCFFDENGFSPENRQAIKTCASDLYDLKQKSTITN